MKIDTYIKDGLTVNDIYRSFERRKRQRLVKAKKLLNNNKTIDKILKSFYAPLLVLPIGAVYFWLLFTIHKLI